MEQVYPFEGCGLLLGRLEGEVKTVAWVWESANVWGDEEISPLFEGEVRDKRHRFAIAPRDLLAAQKSARAQGLEIIGVYHSHPNGPAIPSVFDREIAWSAYSYPIFSVQQGRVANWCCWHLVEGQFQVQAMQILE